MFPGGPPRRAPAPANNSVSGFFKSLYADEFRWSVVKSTGLFLFGIYLAREFKDIEPIGPQTGGA